MVDLGQKKVNASLPFFMPKSQRGGEPSACCFLSSEFYCEPFFFFRTIVCLFLYPNLNGVASRFRILFYPRSIISHKKIRSSKMKLRIRYNLLLEFIYSSHN